MMRWRESLAAVVAYGALALALTWPLALHWGDLVVGAARSDVWNSLWSYWWVATNLWGGRLPLHTTLLDHPVGGRLLVADPVNCLLAAPLVFRGGAVLAHNLLATLHAVFGALAAHALGRRLGGRGWVAGVGYGFSALALGHLHNGASEATSLGWLPLVALALVSLVHRGGVLRTAATGVLLFLCTAAGWYTGLAAWLLLGSLALLGGRGLPRSMVLRRLLPAALLGLLVAVPLARATRAVARADDGLVLIKNPEDLARLRRTLGPADPRIFFVPGDFRAPDFRDLEGNPGDYAHLAYFGWILLGLAVAGPLVLRRQARAPPDGTTDGEAVAVAAAAGAGFLLSLGPVLVWDGFPLEVAGRALPMPYRLVEGLPGFESLSLLYRLAALPVLGVAVLADRAVGRMPQARVLAPLLAVAVLLEVRFVSPAAGLPGLTAVPPHAALQVLAGAPAGAVVNLPVTANRGNLYEQTVHGKPLAATLNMGANHGGLRVLAALRHLRQGDGDRDTVVEQARQADIRYVVLHRDQLVADAFVPSIGALREHFQLLAEDPQVQVFAIW